ncbi:ABC transporter permease [Oceanobacillus halophilus]|uniref:ABC transporter permease n=1 Tax=Oceanobacillus halophilus TaxID=930130 RepID=A0A495A7E8_9BACI|nr:ABC transporter permease [Oceanobacillus halophilus]RKQ35720.1 ABC transporter permease [Oceanobacillus halophilus]
MIKYTIRRILWTIPTIFLAVTAIFFVLRILPSDPASSILGENATPDALRALKEEMGLDKPVSVQYVEFLEGVIRLDFGNSLSSGRSISTEIISLLPYTLELALASVLIATIIGVPIGIYAAIKRGAFVDSIFRVSALIGLSMPAFFLGILMMLAFSLKIPLFPSMGAGEGFVGNLYHLALPALTLGLIESGIVMRITRSSMLDELNKDYVRTARAKGVPRRTVNLKHILRNSLIPVVTVIGLNITTLISGAVLTETVFSRPGLGKLAVGAIETRDYPVLQACLVLFCLLVIFVNLVVDLSYSYLNPKIRP